MNGDFGLHGGVVEEALLLDDLHQRLVGEAVLRNDVHRVLKVKT